MLAESFVPTEHQDYAVLDVGRRKYQVVSTTEATREQLATAAVIVTVESLRPYIRARFQANAGADLLRIGGER